MVVVPIVRVRLDVVDTFEKSERAEGGLGSTGTH
jgi:dUTPase